MHKLLQLTLTLLIATSVHAQMVSGVAMIVEGEAITTSEILTLQKKTGLSREKAVDLLIQDRLQKAAMKDIKVSEKDVDTKIKEIATANNATVPEIQKSLKERGFSWTQYRSMVRSNLKKDKFFKSTVATSIPTPSEDELKIYYNSHKEEFNLPKNVKLIEYSAATEEEIKAFLKTKNLKGIKSKTVNKATKDLNRALLGTILKTPDGSYTRSMNAGNKYISYKVLSKQGKTIMPFDVAKGAVSIKWRRAQQDRALKDYFEKMKLNANIQVIRK